MARPAGLLQPGRGSRGLLTASCQEQAMRRAERLFRIIQVLRRETRPVRAADLAAELEVSPRTVYRDIAELQAQRVPVEGAAGVGYVLGRGYDLPPLMLTEDEIEALLIEARIVESWADPGGRSRPATRWRRSGRCCRTSCGSARSASRSPPRRASRARRSASTWRARAAACASSAKAASPTSTSKTRRASAGAGRSASPSFPPSCCCSAGASCARASAP